MNKLMAVKATFFDEESEYNKYEGLLTQTVIGFCYPKNSEPFVLKSDVWHSSKFLNHDEPTLVFKYFQKNRKIIKNMPPHIYLCFDYNNIFEFEREYKKISDKNIKRQFQKEKKYTVSIGTNKKVKLKFRKVPRKWIQEFDIAWEQSKLINL